MMAYQRNARAPFCAIIKNNSVKNIKDLNKRVLSLFQMDEQFKELLLKTLECKE